MLKCSLIGTGAAGNKAAIKAIKMGVVPAEKVTLLNTTLKDIPQEYRSIAVNFADNTEEDGGCAKERSLSKELLADSIKHDIIDFTEYIDEDDNFVCIVTSTGGGTGAGSAPILARYYNEIGMPVVLFAFTGFEDDLKEKTNTVDFFNELISDYSIHVIANKKFELKSRQACEESANQQFAKCLEVLLGNKLVESEQNIDNNDLFKISTTPGYTIVEYTEVNERIKNVEQFDSILIDMIDGTPALEPPINNQMERMALIMNLNDKSMEFVDNTAREVRERLGICKEEFIHRQYDGGQEFIAVICAGMNMPIDELKSLNERALKEAEEAKKNKESFFDTKLESVSEGSSWRPKKAKINKNKVGRDFFKELDVDTSGVTRKEESKQEEVKEELKEEPTLTPADLVSHDVHEANGEVVSEEKEKSYEFQNTKEYDTESTRKTLFVDLS